MDEVFYLICGSDDLNFDELEMFTNYEGFKKEDAEVKWFWEILKDFDDLEKKKFLMFTTGSDRAPLRGLKDLRFILSKNGEGDERLPSCHTCFNHFLIPCYSSKEVMKAKILQAIENCKGFGLV